MVTKLEQLYEGKAKKIYGTDEPGLYWVEYKDDATAFNALKKGTIAGKGYYNNQISALLFTYLKEQGIPNHFVKLLGEREMLVQALEIIPLEVIVRNIAAGSLSKRLGIPEGTTLKTTVLEFCYKSDELGDPLINEDHIVALELATPGEIAVIKEQAYQISQKLAARYREANLILVDFKLEFGRCGGQILLGDEISPDTCRLWDKDTRKKLDKDRFRQDLVQVEEAYAEVLQRLQGGR
ncbi:MAG: phosphoribosylaminoimidazolesuccinocarboxamide synthase [Clostridia bacterium]|nr:phosphoribosylaminoimidazolesuccinocarboxamide synthase [Clostridia bacterium]